MVEGAKASYPASSFPTLSFSVADCSKPLDPKPEPFSLIFAGWFLNYAGTEEELISMFNVIRENLKEGARFVGITTNPFDERMHTPKTDFYGLDVVILDPEYRAPGKDEVLGIKARVVAHTEPVIQFDVFQFRLHVYERCAKAAALRLRWRELAVPEDEKYGKGYWDRWLERPTFCVIEASKL